MAREDSPGSLGQLTQGLKLEELELRTGQDRTGLSLQVGGSYKNGQRMDGRSC